MLLKLDPKARQVGTRTDYPQGRVFDPQGIGTAGDVRGPSVSVDGELALFDGTTGKKLKEGSTNVVKQTIELDAGYGIILKSPNGTRFKITVLDNGQLQREVL